MFRYIYLFLIPAIFFVSEPVMSEVTVPIDVGIACDAITASTDKIFFSADSKSSISSKKYCVEKHSILNKLIINKINLSYAKELDSYILLLWINGAKSEDLKKLTTSNITRDFVIIKDSKYVLRGVIGAPLDKGVITIGVPDEAAGRKLGDEIAGKHGYSP